MHSTTRALYAALLAHHASLRSAGTDPAATDRWLVTYGDLVKRAGVPILPRGAGPYLVEVAGYCHDRGWPPLNALVVNERKREPGAAYDRAPGCSSTAWRQQVEACARFEEYVADPRDSA